MNKKPDLPMLTDAALNNVTGGDYAVWGPNGRLHLGSNLNAARAWMSRNPGVGTLMERRSDGKIGPVQ
jgi:hypothetical protein